MMSAEKKAKGGKELEVRRGLQQQITGCRPWAVHLVGGADIPARGALL